MFKNIFVVLSEESPSANINELETLDILNGETYEINTYINKLFYRTSE